MSPGRKVGTKSINGGATEESTQSLKAYIPSDTSGTEAKSSMGNSAAINLEEGSSTKTIEIHANPGKRKDKKTNRVSSKKKAASYSSPDKKKLEKNRRASSNTTKQNRKMNSKKKGPNKSSIRHTQSGHETKPNQ